MNEHVLARVLVAPLVSEKSARLVEEDKRHSFRVLPGATKTVVKEAVEKFFDVKVKSVGIMNVKGKRKQFGASTGQRKNWRKACVTLQKGYDIELSDTE